MNTKHEVNQLESRIDDIFDRINENRVRINQLKKYQKKVLSHMTMHQGNDNLLLILKDAYVDLGVEISNLECANHMLASPPNTLATNTLLNTIYEMIKHN